MNVKLLLILSLLLLPPLLPDSSYAEDSQPSDAHQGNGKNGSSKPRFTTAMEEMLLFFDESELIITATKQPQLLKDAPALAVVITAEEIRSMGARDIIDVLKTIPGFGVTKGYYGKEEIEVRGIKTVNSEKVKLLIDGHSVNDNMTGGAVWGFDSLTVDNVKRIEVIRGPGSALYGGNAFSGVINVITKDGKDIGGVIVTGGGGSFDTGKVNLQAGKKINEIDVAVSLDYLNTNGPTLKIDKDILGNAGYTKDFEEKVDAGLKVSYKDFTFNSKLISRQRGVYIGPQYAINDESKNYVQQYFGDLTYRHSFNEDNKITVRTYIDELDWKTYWELYPEGTSLPFGNFPSGMIGVPSLRERDLGMEVQTDTRLTQNNLLTLGALAEKKDQFHVGYEANYNPITFSPDPSGLVSDVVSIGNWNQEKAREIWAVYLQDLWDITDNIGLTIGVRHDQYSDFGDTTNPRAALVWRFLDNWDMKFLYGEAFRAPSFEELYNINNPAVQGNTSLKPERMKTGEASLGYKMGHGYQSRISYFYNIFKDQIRNPQFFPGIVKFENKGGAKVQGVEAEVRKEFKKDDFLYLNYVYQWPEDEETGTRLPDVPNQRGNIGGNMGLTRYLNVNSNIFLSSERPRSAGDTRDSIPAYALVDLTIIAKNFYKNLEIRGAVHNLLDKQYTDPAPAGTIAGDFPREGVNYMLEAFYKF